MQDLIGRFEPATRLASPMAQVESDRVKKGAAVLARVIKQDAARDRRRPQARAIPSRFQQPARGVAADNGVWQRLC
jgi:hypothetical protein